MALSISQNHRDARSQATINFADAAAAPSHITLTDLNGTTLVDIILAKPCGVLEGGLIRLQQANALGDQITTEGVVVTGTWFNGYGETVAQGTVSDSAGNGDFKISSAAGTSLYVGGYVLLGTSSLS